MSSNTTAFDTYTETPVLTAYYEIDKSINLIKDLYLTNDELISFLTILKNEELVRLYE